ncbi:MAG: DNA double-strand break repair nuclease NurA, partial [Candidatus Omnitrophota bacterium]
GKAETIEPQNTSKKSQTKRQDLPPSVPYFPDIKKKSESSKSKIRQTIESSHVITQLLAATATLSAQSQSDYLGVLETIATQIREKLEAMGKIKKVEIQHNRLWLSVKNKKIAFIDGGMANMASLGSAPIAIRVGSYVVKPGTEGPEREAFDFEIQLVGELYQSGMAGEGIFDGLDEDIDRMKDVARICLETAGAIKLAERKEPDFIFMHGPLVNPVSMYSYKGFPNFSAQGLEFLLPEKERERTGHDANFIRVHLAQLRFLQSCKAVTCGVIERSSNSTLVAQAYINLMCKDQLITNADADVFKQRLREFKISDSILFECVLNEAEYMEPIPINKNEYYPGRTPDIWMQDLKDYPLPSVSFMKPSQMSSPVRVEMFECSLGKAERIFDLLVHSSRLLPQYAFPAGLDIVDKHSKIPNWMTRPINARLSAQIMKKALETKNPTMINAMRRMLCNSPRDMMFRPGIFK